MTQYPPSRRSIAKASAVAFAVAMLVLVTAILPAEYGIDPLGTGRATGLLDLYQAATAPIAPDAGGPVTPQANTYRVDARQLTVPSLGSVEFKYQLAKGESFVYSWRASAPVDFDFHTEPAGRPAEASETFERGEAAQKQGIYTAPYDGIHGWYWENLFDTDVVVTLEAAGFFTEGRLFLANAAPQRVVIPPRTESE
jgi:hypothetical protein